MVIGSVLLQPRKVTAPAVPPGTALLEDVVAVAVRLTWDQAHGGACMGLIEKGLGNSLQRLRDGMKNGEAGAVQKLTAWAQPFLDKVSALGQALPGSSVRHETLQGGEALLGLIIELLDGITTDQLSKHLDFVLGVLQNDLGLTNTFIDQQVTAIFDEMLTSLRSGAPEQDPTVRENRLEIIALVRRIRRQVEGQFNFPAINVDRLAGPLLSQLRAMQYDDFLHRAGLIGTSVKAGLDVVGVVSDVVPFNKGFRVGVGAAAPATIRDHAWYASWVNGAEVRSTTPTSDPTLSKFSFKHVNVEDMEKITLHATWITTALDGILVGVTGMKRDNYAITVTSMVRDTLYTILAPAAGVNIPTLIDSSPSDSVVLQALANRLDKLWNVVTTLLCSLEGRSLDKYDAVLYFFRFLFKFGGSSLPVDKVRDMVLSIITLYNHDKTVTPPPENRNNDGLIQLFVQIIGTLILAAIIPDNYFCVTGKFFLAAILGALGMSILTFFSGMFLSAAIAQDWPDPGSAAKSWVKGWLLSHLSLIGFLFLLYDGSTNGGKRGYIPDSSTNLGAEVTFDGYPDNSASPYLLPFVGSAECVQGNHGFWSHNSLNNQVFAYDFSINYDQEVLCMRDGTVAEVVDNVDDGDHSIDGNHIIIKHTTMNATHDKDVGGVARTTYARYYHGKKGGIAEAFGGTAPAIGAAVTQGQLIMKANSTGNSAFNHIHVDVQPEMAGSPGTRNGYTIPFVFKDADNNGVPKSRTVYDSQNVKKP